MRKVRCILSGVAGIVLGLAAQAGAPAPSGTADAPANDAATYQTCMAKARQAPADGFEMGSQWQGHGGGEPAEHCIDIALIGLKRFTEAGQHLEVLATGMVRDPQDLRAEALSQAAEAWSEGGKPAQAEADLNEAIRLNPNSFDYRVDRATARAAQNNYVGAIDDLTAVINAGTQRGDVFAYRAAAYRLSGDVPAAISDAERAVQAAPDLPEAWLERANARRLSGNNDGARQDWMKVIALAPDTAAADAAQHNIAALDANPGTGEQTAAPADAK